jgi:hypothetical protein
VARQSQTSAVPAQGNSDGGRAPHVRPKAGPAVQILQGDSAVVAHGTGTYASRSAVLAGGAATLASRLLKER